jgi:hypothetical protein
LHAREKWKQHNQNDTETTTMAGKRMRDSERGENGQCGKGKEEKREEEEGERLRLRRLYGARFVSLVDREKEE